MAVAGTSFDRSFPLELDAQHRSAFAKAGDRNGQPYVFKIKGWPFWWWMRNASEVSLRAVSEADSPGVSKVAFEAERKSEKYVPGRMKFRPHPEGGLGRTRTVVCLIVSEYQFRFFPSPSHQYICRLHRNCS